MDGTQWDSPKYAALHDVAAQRPQTSRLSSSSAADTEANATEQIYTGMERLLVDIRDLMETSIRTTERLLANVHDLMETKVRTEVRLRRDEEENRRMMTQWVVAAKVIDRIFFILITLFFIGGTTCFVVLFRLLSDSSEPQ